MMNLFKKILVFIGLSLTLLLGYGGSKNTIQTIKTDSEKTLFSENSTVNSAFIQPEIVTHVVVNFKVNQQSIIKFFDTYLDLIPALKTPKIVTAFTFQDINRCNKVSLLLFPHHIFW